MINNGLCRNLPEPGKRWMYVLMVLALFALLSKKNQNIAILSSIIVKQSQTSLVVVPIKINFECDGDIQQFVCTETLLLEHEDDISLKHISDENTMNNVCNVLRHSGKRIVEYPVCIQSSNTVGIMGIYIEASNEVQLISETTNKYVQDFIQSNPSEKIRIIGIKRVDFPSNYRRMSDINNKVKERYRDGNYGNMMWRYGSSRLLNPATTRVDSNDKWENNTLADGPVDALVVASANTFHVSVKPMWQDYIEMMTDRVKLRDVPTVVLGVGAQVEFVDMEHYDLDDRNLSLPFEFQKDWFVETSKRQIRPAIGARGDLTRSVCINSGIENCVSMGCPSLTISRDTNLGKTLKDNWSRLIQKLQNKENVKIALPLAQHVGQSDTVRTAYGYVARMLELYGDAATVIEQSTSSKTKMTEFIEKEYKKINPDTRLQSTNVKYASYLNVESWLIEAKKFDLCISFRIHGSMSFIAAGVPTIVIPTDFRILELINAMKLPFLHPDELQTHMVHDINSSNSTTKSNDLVLSVLDDTRNQNFTDFELNRREKILGWKSILQTAGLEIDPALMKIINSPL